jgi:hypothetical protein
MEPSDTDQFTPEESIQRRNETLRRMLNTPPQQHATSPPQTSRSRKKADAADACQAADKPEKA